jgi:hypothetical protein
VPSWGQQQQQRSPLDADAQIRGSADAQRHPSTTTAQSREESTIRGEDIYFF